MFTTEDTEDTEAVRKLFLRGLCVLCGKTEQQ